MTGLASLVWKAKNMSICYRRLAIARGTLLALAVIALGIVSTTARGNDVPIGTEIENLEFKDIRYLPRTLSDLGAHEAYVFAFTNTTCPLVRRYMPRLIELEKKFRDRDVQFVSVNVGADDSIMATASHALEFGAGFPFVKDFGAECATRLGVPRTPGVAVLDRQHRLVYRGRIDDQYRLGGVLPTARRADLERALEQLLAGESIEIAETPIDGCAITAVDPEPVAPGSITFHHDVAPIVEAHCVPCHRKGTAAPFTLTSYRRVKSHGAMVAEVVDEGRMPPWYASPRYGHFENDRSLSDAERHVIIDWVRSGMAEGEPNIESTGASEASSKAVDPAQGPWKIGPPDLVLTTLLPDSLPADGFVPYKYAVLPHLFLAETWLESIEILPSNKAVVHHANLAYASKDEKPGAGTFITGFVPGGQAMDLRHFEGVAFRIPALSVMGLQIHYVTTGKPETCRISVGLRFKRGSVAKQLYHGLADPHRFRIPKKHPAYPVRDSFTLGHPVSLLGLFTHMHLRGKDMTFFAHYPNGETETLLEIPNYNFDWQLGYEIRPGDKHLPKGTTIEAVAHYDNSSFNPYNPDPNKVVRYGPQTIHEMMNGYVFFTRDDEKLKHRIDPKTGWVIKRPAKKAHADL